MYSFRTIRQIHFPPATVTQTGFPRAMSVSKKGPPIETMSNRSFKLKKLLWISPDGVMSVRLTSLAVIPLIAEMKQVRVLFLARIGFIWLSTSGSRSIVTARKMKSLSSMTRSRLFVAYTFGESRGTLSIPPRRLARSSVR